MTNSRWQLEACSLFHADLILVTPPPPLLEQPMILGVVLPARPLTRHAALYIQPLISLTDGVVVSTAASQVLLFFLICLQCSRNQYITTCTSAYVYRFLQKPVQEIGRRTTVITQDTRETVFLFQRLSIALQRGNAVCQPT